MRTTYHQEPTKQSDTINHKDTLRKNNSIINYQYLKQPIPACREVVFDRNTARLPEETFETFLYNVPKGQLHTAMVIHCLKENIREHILMKKIGLKIVRFFITERCEVIFV